jgi:hypothetical protein
VDDDEIFTRLLYAGTVQMGLSEDRFWLMPMGLFLDLWACHKQWLGLENAQHTVSIDDVLPLNLL